MIVRIVCLSLLFIAFSCKKANGEFSLKKELAVKEKNNKALNKGYDFANPTVLNLTHSLREISGLSFYNGFIYALNDEKGIVFKINSTTATIVDKIYFGKDADYEGIEILNNKAIIVKSNGNLIFYDFDTDKMSIKKNQLKTENDVEGLCIWDSNKLLMACKGQMIKDDSKGKSKGIYTYNLNKQKLNKKPFLVIEDEYLVKYIKAKYKNTEISKKKRKKLQDRVTNFSPSGIAIHPRTKKIYIISARGNTLLIYDALKELEDIVFLNQEQLPQPEGICFDAIENLYISTETKGEAGRIYKYMNN